MENTTDALSKLRIKWARETVYSAALLRKVIAVSRTYKITRLITVEELAELASVHAGVKTTQDSKCSSFFVFNGSRIVVFVRESDDIIIRRWS